MALWRTLVSSLSGEDRQRAPFTPQDFRGPRRMKEGYIWGESLIMPRPCTIRDLSPLTAQVVLWHDDIKPHLLSRELKLFSSADRKEADCVVIARQDNVLALRFTSAFRAPSRTYP